MLQLLSILQQPQAFLNLGFFVLAVLSAWTDQAHRALSPFRVLNQEAEHDSCYFHKMEFINLARKNLCIAGMAGYRCSNTTRTHPILVILTLNVSRYDQPGPPTPYPLNIPLFLVPQQNLSIR